MKGEIQGEDDSTDEGEGEEDGLQGEKRKLDAKDDGEEEDDWFILRWDWLILLEKQESDHIFVSPRIVAIPTEYDV